MSSRTRLAVAVLSGIVLLATVFVAVPYWLVMRDGMLEISVVESGEEGDRVHLRVPASVVRVAAAFVPRIEPGIDDAEAIAAIAAVGAAIEAMEEVDDAVFVSVDEPGTRVRIAKRDGRFVVEVDDGGDRVRISVPPVALRVIADALPRLSGSKS
jgi:hypothetical protein